MFAPDPVVRERIVERRAVEVHQPRAGGCERGVVDAMVAECRPRQVGREHYPRGYNSALGRHDAGDLGYMVDTKNKRKKRKRERD